MRFAPTLPVKHAICPRHRSSWSHIGCDRAIHTLLPIRHHLLQKKRSICHPSAVTGCQAEGIDPHRPSAQRLPMWGEGAEARGHDGRCSTAMNTPHAQSGGDSFPHFNNAPKQKLKPGIIVFYLQELLSQRLTQLIPTNYSYQITSFIQVL